MPFHAQTHMHAAVCTEAELSELSSTTSWPRHGTLLWQVCWKCHHTYQGEQLSSHVGLCFLVFLWVNPTGMLWLPPQPQSCVQLTPARCSQPQHHHWLSDTNSPESHGPHPAHTGSKTSWDGMSSPRPSIPMANRARLGHPHRCHRSCGDSLVANRAQLHTPILSPGAWWEPSSRLQMIWDEQADKRGQTHTQRQR